MLPPFLETAFKVDGDKYTFRGWAVLEVQGLKIISWQKRGALPEQLVWEGGQSCCPGVSAARFFPLCCCNRFFIESSCSGLLFQIPRHLCPGEQLHLQTAGSRKSRSPFQSVSFPSPPGDFAGHVVCLGPV